MYARASAAVVAATTAFSPLGGFGALVRGGIVGRSVEAPSIMVDMPLDRLWWTTGPIDPVDVSRDCPYCHGSLINHPQAWTLDVDRKMPVPVE